MKPEAKAAPVFTPGACTCGLTEDHIIATRKTADDRIVHLWNDGQVTFALGVYLRGIGRSRSASGRRLDLRAGWIVLGEVESYDAEELPALVRAAQRAVRLPGANSESALAQIRWDARARGEAEGGAR